MSQPTLTIPTTLYTSMKDKTAIGNVRYNILLLQALVAIVLSYQVLFTPQSLFSGISQLPVVLGLLLSCAAVMAVPDRWVWSAWFTGALALGDTAIVTGLIFVTGNLQSDLYLAYFIILLIAAISHTPKQTFLFVSIVCVLYGLVLYREIQATGMVFEHHLLRIPFLMIMGIFYSRTIESLRALAEYDPLTGLPNHRTFLFLADAILARAGRAQVSAALFFLNLDGFKLINETLGRRIADQLLVEVATRLTQGPGQYAIMARESGDEFLLLVDRVSTPQECIRFAEEIVRSLDPPVSLADREIFVTTSIGIALFPQDAPDTESLIKNADAAVSHAKHRGKNTYQFYSAELDTQAQQMLELIHSLRVAFHRQELRVFYQPQIEIKTGNIVGLEALIRWAHPEHGLMPPNKFIGVAEETGIIGPMGRWILREACRQVKAWHDSGRPRVTLSVNMSARQLSQLDLVSLTEETLQETGLDARYLEIELVESLLLQDQDDTVRTLRALKALGIRLALDDFGTGYSSLSYLKRFPIDTLKIDQSFIRDLTTQGDARAIVTAIIAMAHALNLKVIAEGVESEEQAAFLRQEGCLECQGFLYSRPLPGEEMAQLLDRWPVHDLEAAPPILRAVRPRRIR